MHYYFSLLFLIHLTNDFRRLQKVEFIDIPVKVSKDEEGDSCSDQSSRGNMHRKVSKIDILEKNMWLDFVIFRSEID